MDEKFSVVGKPVIREDGVEKVTGRAKFGDDYRYENMLYAVMLRIPETHARINHIDFSPVAESKSIETICTSDDVPGKKNIGVFKLDQPVFCDKKVVTPGDVLAMLVGESEAELRELVKKIKVDYTVMPALTDPRLALDKSAPLVHEESGSNLVWHHPLHKGNVEKGFAESEYIIEHTYTTQLIEHAYIEPEAVIAIPLGPSRGVKVIGSIQNPFTTRRLVSFATGLPLSKVRIEQAHLGGSFGGKDDTMCMLSARAAIAAIKTDRPVKIHYTREESILESYKRHPYIMDYKVGFSGTGKIKAMKIDVIADGGAYVSMSPFVTWRTVVQATGPYEIENVDTDVKVVYTNNPYAGAMRGFGSPQPIFAQESLMDEIAAKLDISPVEIRKINALKEGSVTASGQIMKNHDVNLIKVLEAAVDNSGFNPKYDRYRLNNKIDFNVNAEDPVLKNEQYIKPEEAVKKGIGLAVSFRGCSLGAEGVDAAAAYLSLQSDGTAYLNCGLAENGQGLKTTFSIIASEVLGIAPDNIYYLELDTGITPDSGPTVASRSTIIGGSAVKDAAEIIKARFVELIRKEWKLAPDAEIKFKDNKAFTADGKPLTTFAELCGLAYSKGVCLASIGWYNSPSVHWDEENGQGDAYFTYVYACQIAEVRVNIATGEIYVDKVTAVHDPGTVINRLGAEGQIYGGVTQGVGYGIFEEISTSNGLIRELNFDTYTIPTSKDVGDITPIFIEGKDKSGPWGGKSLGEPTLELAAAAVANAVYNATGKRFFNLPLNLEEVLLGKKLYPAAAKRGSQL